MRTEWLASLKPGDEVAVEVTDAVLDEIPRYAISTVKYLEPDTIYADGRVFKMSSGFSRDGHCLEPVTDVIRANVRRHYLLHLVRTGAQLSRLVKYEDAVLERVLDILGVAHSG